MTAHHLPCTHIRRWQARCFLAKLSRDRFCRVAMLQFSYPEYFLCPDCMVALKVEKGGLPMLHPRKIIGEEGERVGVKVKQEDVSM